MSPQASRRRLRTMGTSPEFEKRISAPADVRTIVTQLPRPLVFTNGVFDILHRGHVTYLAQARALGASLVVALNSDASARRLGKGADRPLNTLFDRAAVIAALRAVDVVIWFETDTPLELVVSLKPDILVKGGDWKPDAIVGAKEVQSWGGSVHSIAFDHQRSTTELISRVRSSAPS